MASAGVRRHAVYLSDAEIVLNERALRAYNTILEIQTNKPPKADADHVIRLHAMITGHMRCTCPVPLEEGDL